MGRKKCPHALVGVARSGCRCNPRRTRSPAAREGTKDGNCPSHIVVAGPQPPASNVDCDAGPPDDVTRKVAKTFAWTGFRTQPLEQVLSLTPLVALSAAGRTGRAAKKTIA